MSQFQVSFVIPTYNGADRIHIPLEALALQKCAEGTFEVIVIDNNSTDGTSQLVETLSSTAQLRKREIEVRIIREERKGLTYARLRGVQESRAKLVCFLDDYTSPEPEYVVEDLTALADPKVGLLVSRLFPRYATKVPRPSIQRREHLLAINNKLGEAVLCFGAAGTIAPTVGAGMWVRREGFLRAVPWENPELLLSDRLGNQLFAGGDIEIGLLMGRAGFERVYWPKLCLYHIIPETRLQTGYFCRLIVGTVRSAITLEARYEARGRAYSRSKSLLRMVSAILAVPVLLCRKDGLHELLFVLVSRWAELRGPYTFPRQQAGKIVDS